MTRDLTGKEVHEALADYVEKKYGHRPTVSYVLPIPGGADDKRATTFDSVAEVTEEELKERGLA